MSRRAVGEPVWQGHSEVELIECQRHESLLDVAFGHEIDWWLLCPYNIGALDDAEFVDEARRSHPHLLVDGQHHVSRSLNSDMESAFLDAPLPAPPAMNATLRFGADDLRVVRDHVAGHVVASGMSASRGFACWSRPARSRPTASSTGALTVSSGSGTTAAAWCASSPIVVGSMTRLAGRTSPDVDAEERGLDRNQLCDLVQVRVFDSGTVVRLHMALS